MAPSGSTLNIQAGKSVETIHKMKVIKLQQSGKSSLEFRGAAVRRNVKQWHNIGMLTLVL
jgi:hypothetical protein